MEREIRFRAFDNKHGKMVHPDVFCVIDGTSVYKLNPHHEDDNYYKLDYEDGRFDIMQFTGLRDKDNQELYESDLFKCETNDIIYRIWAVKGGFAINTHVKMWQKEINSSYPFPLIPLADEQTVSWIENSCNKVGNVFENPELLTASELKN